MVLWRLAHQKDSEDLQKLEQGTCRQMRQMPAVIWRKPMGESMGKSMGKPMGNLWKPENRWKFPIISVIEVIINHPRDVWKTYGKPMGNLWEIKQWKRSGRQLGWLFPNYGRMNNFSNHQPERFQPSQMLHGAGIWIPTWKPHQKWPSLK